MAANGGRSPLDSFLPHWHWRARSTAIFPTSALAVFNAAREVTLGELPTAASLRRVDPGVTVVDDLVGQGFVPLCEPDDAVLVLGRIGQLWQQRRGTAPGHGVAAGGGSKGFGDSEARGQARAVVLFEVQGHGHDSLLAVEARVEATDERILQGYSRHWTVAAWSNRLVYREFIDAVRARLDVKRFSARPLTSTS